MRGLSKMAAHVAETRADQCYSGSEFARFDLHVPGPVKDLKVIRRIDQNRSVRDLMLHGRYSTKASIYNAEAKTRFQEGETRNLCIRKDLSRITGRGSIL